MKLYIINPDYGVSRQAMDERCRMLQTYTGGDVEIRMDCLTQTKVEIDSTTDVFLAAPEILQMGLDAEKQGYDAVILYCFSDPAIDALREQLSIPVIGGAQAGMLSALYVSRHASVLLADKKRIPEKKIFLRHMGIDAERISGVDAIDFGGKSIWGNREQALQELIVKGKEMKEAGAECVVLGCLSFLGLAGSLSDALDMPVIDPAICAVTTAEMVVRQGLRTSKISYPNPN